jgi:N-acetylneuraminate 9-O-acetyltransferase
MVVAWVHPHIESAWADIDAMHVSMRSFCRAAVAGISCSVLYLWYVHVYSLDKFEYNAVHPYTSWIPITAWIALRNLTPYMRQHSIGFLSWMGCITLETYIGQFHIWLRSGIPDGQPKLLLELVCHPPLCNCCMRLMRWILCASTATLCAAMQITGYPLANFLLCSILYIGASYRLFNLTNVLKSVFVPHDDIRMLGRNILLMAISAGVLYVAAGVFHTFIYQSVQLTN